MHIFEVMKESSDNVLGFKAIGKITPEHYINKSSRADSVSWRKFESRPYQQ